MGHMEPKQRYDSGSESRPDSELTNLYECVYVCMFV